MLLGVIDNQKKHLSGLGIQVGDHPGCFEPECSLRRPPEHIQEVVESASMRPSSFIEVSIEGRYVMTAPCKCHQDNQGLEVLKVIPKELIFKRIKERLEFFGYLDDLKHNGSPSCIQVLVNLYIDEIAVFC
jgi:hypothetical protein